MFWAAAANADGYRVEWGTTSGAYTDSATTTSTSYAIKGLQENTTYYVRVTATRTGAADGTPSDEDEATTLPSPPGQVTGVTATAVSSSSINVGWADATNADGYRVQWGTTSGSYTDSAATASTSYAINGLQENTTYYVRVAALRNGAADGTPSAETQATTFRSPPAKVTGVSAAAASDTSINVTWSAAARADGYKVEWGATSGSYTDSATTTSTSYVVSGLSANTTYYLRVVGTRTGTADGTPSDETSAVTPSPAPARVSGVSVTADDYDSITVTWSAVTSADGYVVQWDDDSAFTSPSDVVVASGSTVTRQITGLQEGTQYWVRVYATRAGAADGPASSPATDTTALQAPARVTNLRARAASDVAVNLAWDLALRAGGYRIEWGTSPGTYTERASTAALAYTVTGLSAHTVYYFRVTATRSGAPDGARSVERSARTNTALPPGQVTGLSATAISDREIQATWNAAANATGYVVQWDTDSAFPGPEQAAVANTGAIVEFLRAETEYFVRVRGTRNGAADGAWSSADSATTEDSRVKVWAERFPGGQVPAQLFLGAFAGVLAGVRFKSMKPPRREAVITGTMSLGALILPMFGLANDFWVIGIALLVLLCSIATIFIARR